MTEATKVLLAHLRQHVGADPARGKALYAHCCQKIGRKVSRATLHRIIHRSQEPKADMLIPILRWLQMEGVIEPGEKSVGLFIYTRPLKTDKQPKKAPVKSPVHARALAITRAITRSNGTPRAKK